MALKESHDDQQRYHRERTEALQKRYDGLQRRIDAMYVDKLDGNISQDYFEQKSTEWTAEQARILRKIDSSQKANRSYIEEGIKILELSQRAAALYDKQEMHEKRRLLDFVFSNSTWKDGKLIPNYRKPFDLLAITNTKYRGKRRSGMSKKDAFEIWRAQEDSNLQPADS